MHNASCTLRFTYNLLRLLRPQWRRFGLSLIASSDLSSVRAIAQTHFFGFYLVSLFGALIVVSSVIVRLIFKMSTSAMSKTIQYGNSYVHFCCQFCFSIFRFCVSFVLLRLI